MNAWCSDRLLLMTRVQQSPTTTNSIFSNCKFILAKQNTKKIVSTPDSLMYQNKSVYLSSKPFQCFTCWVHVQWSVICVWVMTHGLLCSCFIAITVLRFSFLISFFRVWIFIRCFQVLSMSVFFNLFTSGIHVHVLYFFRSPVRDYFQWKFGKISSH